MATIHYLVGAQPPPRGDAVPWNRVRVERSTVAAGSGGPYTTVVTQTLSPLDSNPAQPQVRNITFSDTEAVAWYRLVFLDAADNTSIPTSPVLDDGSGLGGDTPVITRTDYKTLFGIASGDSSKDARIDLLIPWVQVVVRNYSGRDFGEATTGPSERSFFYDGSSFCDIDDCSAITQVKLGTSIIASTQWVAKPETDPTDPTAYWWLENLPWNRNYSPEMGFTQNWDVFGVPANQRLYVTATWGWPTIPGDVKMAAAWILHSWIEVPGAFTSESIEGYSRSINLPRGLEDAIPRRSQMILEAYDRGPVL